MSENLKTNNDPRFLRGRMYLPDLLDFIEYEANTRDEQVDALKKYAEKDQAHSTLLQRFVHMLFRDDIQMDLPDNDPGFRENEAPDYPYAGRNLFKVIRQLDRFMYKNGNNPDYIVKRAKREKLFMIFLESVHPKEAYLLLAMKNKDLTPYYSQFTLGLVREAVPEMLPENLRTAGNEGKKAENESDSAQLNETPTEDQASSETVSSSQAGSSTTSQKKSNTGNQSKKASTQKSSGKSNQQSGQAKQKKSGSSSNIGDPKADDGQQESNDGEGSEGGE